jgi:hypothetical protein
MVHSTTFGCGHDAVGNNYNAFSIVKRVDYVYTSALEVQTRESSIATRKRTGVLEFDVYYVPYGTILYCSAIIRSDRPIIPARRIRSWVFSAFEKLENTRFAKPEHASR